ncbi:polysaccharide deacetylase family protein [Sutcliffiella horikoshii]|uniref:polysaccharide deacetylase family protein n=1 Tax=Sutcliffiella horikoshii TaxID=79883 RepID=UPI001F2FD487|nr:polysaccharide deacetylase family protein [Sutcliffiella horikoshii]MCG1020480.1 polysaccharide deacetylase family protein [Sutcliffiella horikoshii]
MKKWVLSALLLLLLVACGQTGQVDEEQGSDAVDSQTEENEPTEDKVDDEDEVPATAQEDLAEEKEPEADKSEDSGGTEETEENQDTTNEDGTKETQEPQYIVNESNWTLEPINDANPDVVLLTIDDAPDRYALEMATILKELNVQAIFFVNGHFLETEQERNTLKQIYDMGFPIGNHTMTHKSLRQLTEEEQYEEIVALSDRVEEITGERPRFFRAPFGTNTDYAKELVKQEGMILMNWTYGYDWETEYMDAEALADIMVNTELLSSGSNLLMHDREWTKDALADIVKGLQAKNYDIMDPALIGTEEQETESE